MMYNEEDYLSLSGIQHYAFCKRQWALIHIEQQWAENVRTVEGNQIHKRAHSDLWTESDTGTMISRGMPVFSHNLGINGVCDVVEFHRSDNGVSLYGKEGRYKVVPVEYKKGSPKDNEVDALQLCAQAICLEEMLCCTIPAGYLYYNTVRRRTEVKLEESLRDKVKTLFYEMHQMYNRQHTPKVKRTKSCNACSLKHVCEPKLNRIESVENYIDRHM